MLGQTKKRERKKGGSIQRTSPVTESKFTMG